MSFWKKKTERLLLYLVVIWHKKHINIIYFSSVATYVCMFYRYNTVHSNRLYIIVKIYDSVFIGYIYLALSIGITIGTHRQLLQL